MTPDDTCPTCGPICGLREFTPADTLDKPVIVGHPDTWEATGADN